MDELVDLLLQNRISMPFSPEQFSCLNPFAVILRYEETPYINMSLEEMEILIDLAYHWAYEVIFG